MILGACIGALSAFVQAVFQPASVRVLRGWQEGREYPLDRVATLLGRAEDADISIFRDMKVEKRHAMIRREGERYVFVNNGAPADETKINEAPIAGRRDLADGDRIQLGNVVLRFQARAAVERKGPRRGGQAMNPSVSPGSVSRRRFLCGEDLPTCRRANPARRVLLLDGAISSHQEGASGSAAIFPSGRRA